MEMGKPCVLFQTQYFLSSVLFCANGRGFPWGTINCVWVWIPLTHVPLSSKPMLQSALHQLLVRIFFLAVPGKPSCTQYFHEPYWTLPHLAEGITVSRSTCFTDSTWNCEEQWQWSSFFLSCRYYCGICVHTWGTQHAPQFQPETSLFLHKPGKILPFSSTARWTGAGVTLGAPWCSPTGVNAKGVWEQGDQ